MQAKDLMEQVRRAEEELELIQAKRQHYLAMGGIQASRITGMPSGGHSQESRVETAAVSMADLAAELDRAAESYSKLIVEAEALVNQIEQINFRRVLTYHYFLGQPLPEVGRRMGYRDEKSVYHTKGYALRELQKLLDRR